MRDVIRERWRDDVARLRSARGNVDVPAMVAAWAQDPAWAAAVRGIPPGERRGRLAELGAETYDGDVGNFASELRWNTRSLGHLWTPEHRERVLRRHVQVLFAAASDAVDFGGGGRAPSPEGVAVSGMEHLAGAADARRGIVFLSAYQCHVAFALRHPCLRERRIGVVQHMDEPGHGIVPLGDGGGALLVPASRGSVRTMLRLLADGECVAFYNDFIYPGVAPVRSTLFGRPVLTSRAIVSLALRTGAAVLPFCITRQFPLDGDEVRLEIFPPLPLEPRRDPDDAYVQEAAQLFGLATEYLIRRYPAQWRLWNSLEHRWSEAEARC